ncbi:carbohydrate ABC transporter permease [Turicibacter sanguinis]|jgi:ABC transporter, permease protein|uniref:carbohydrate ABC transporter permease n=3 Tax=Turicibacter TaxID=191303 RepID=UPI0006C20DBE|nr:sugar ABC transporter permease [Turicibacter sanguinis]MDB8458245.1 sugar ABC transporter permease [Turicibacter sanguinis]MDB8555308.1 sugar ABC transporter permease [Turicibacter sanguinis]MDB8557177.1 sugar ABC transporter permease [Turicibacter sanguinis]MDB8559950.1 sugar ABC transporter permease [Turicibacter sanguinis]MDB8565711.1 sugar ABC transporter permease [Turicibacter sanguinis]
MTNKAKLLKQKIKNNKAYYFLLAPYIILFTLFTVVPVVMSMGLSFTYFNMLEPPKFVFLDNYIRLFVEDEVFQIALKNTLFLAIITGPLSYIMAFIFAWVINEFKPKLRAVLTLVFYAPSIAGNAFLIWLIIFSGDVYGFANAYLMEWGIIDSPIQWLQDPDYMIWILIIVQLWLSLGVSFLAFMAGLQNVDTTLYEAGAIDGIKNRWQELWHITLPSMKSQLLFGAVMQITQSFAISNVSVQLVGFPSVDYAGHTIVTHLMDYGQIRYELGYASAIATVLFAIMLLSNLVVQKLLRKVGS